MLTDLGMNIPANGPFVISQVLNKGKKSKSKQGILEIRATFGSACSAGYALAGACCAPRQDPRRAAHCKYRSGRIQTLTTSTTYLFKIDDSTALLGKKKGNSTVSPKYWHMQWLYACFIWCRGYRIVRHY